MSNIKPGQKLASSVCSTEVMVIKAPTAGLLCCGGVEMVAAGSEPASGEKDDALMGGCQIGKRYVNEDQSLEVLCVKAGEGSLSVDGAALTIKEANKIPSTD